MKKIILAALICLSPQVALADAAAKAAELYDFTTPDTTKEIFNDVIDIYSKSIKQEVAASNSCLNNDMFVSDFSSMIKRAFDPADLREFAINLYVRKFTEEELQQLIDFNKSPVGQKALKLMPEIYREITEYGQKKAMEQSDFFKTESEKIVGKYIDVQTGQCKVTGM